MKILKYIITTFFILLTIYCIAFIFIAGAYVGNNGTGKIEFYKYKSDSITFRTELKNIENISDIITIKDSLDDYGGGYIKPLFVIDIKNKKTLKRTNYILSYYTSTSSYDSITRTSLYLIKINKQTNNQLGWFSLEKYREVKLFEETIIKPLSKNCIRLKYDRGLYKEYYPKDKP